MGLFGNPNKKIHDKVMKEAKRVTVRCPKCGRTNSAMCLGRDVITCVCGNRIIVG